MSSTMSLSQLTSYLPDLRSLLTRNRRYVVVPAAAILGYFALRGVVKDRLDYYFFNMYMNRCLENVDAMVLEFREEMKDLMAKQQSENREPSGDGKFHILEIGMGPGTSLEFYPKGSSVIGVEPNKYFVEVLLEKQKKYPDLECVILGGAEDLANIEDESIDAVVSTVVLCSVQDLDKSLKEVKRVLVKGGRFYFFEHVADTTNRRRCMLQILMNPFWRMYYDGCQLTRHVRETLTHLGFEMTHVEEGHGGDYPYLIKRYCKGYATKC